jgi:calcineurin-like phosphoesterase family protein
MAQFFISDTHFGHAAIIGMCHRPFTGVDEMDEALIERWNAAVAPGDVVYHLGDVCYRNAKGADAYMKRLNGSVHLIAGNHDKHTLESFRASFASVSDIREVRIGERRVVLCHYPMREWHGSWRGAWHLFGHVHGRLNHAPLGYSLDVGADSHDFRPWSEAEIGEAMAGRDNPFSGSRPSVTAG